MGLFGGGGFSLPSIKMPEVNASTLMNPIGSATSSLLGGIGSGGLGSLNRTLTGGNIASNVFGTGGSKADGSAQNLSKGDIEGYMEQGRAKGEELTGTSSKDVGAGRADVRSRLQQTLDGNSAGANSLRQSQNSNMKSLKSSQALAGGGQMNVGQQQALERQGARDLAEFTSNEKRQALSDISREWRGAGTDIMKSEGQYGSILVGMQPTAQPATSNSLMDQIFGGIF